MLPPGSVFFRDWAICRWVVDNVGNLAKVGEVENFEKVK